MTVHFQKVFSIILGQFTKEEKALPLNELSQELPTTPILGEKSLELTTTDTEQEAKSIDEHLLEDLLSIVSVLQQDSQTKNFPTLNASPTLEKLLASEATRQEFANVKSVSDLVDLSQKYNLGLEKLSISKENVESLQTKFPTLTKNNFFDDLKTALDTPKNTLTKENPIITTTTNLMSVLDNNNNTKTEKNTNVFFYSECVDF